MKSVLKWIICCSAAIVIIVVGLYCCLCLISGTIIRYEVHNSIVESSPEYLQVIDDVMREVYTAFAKENMESAETWLKESKGECSDEYYQEEKLKLEKAKELISTNPEKAAELYMLLGSCHEIWHRQKTILKERYGIIWYSPSEVHPNTIYD